MRTTEATNDFKTPGRCFGDGKIIYGGLKTDFWNLLIFRTKIALWILFTDFIKFSSAIVNIGINVFFHYRFSPHNLGLILVVFTTSFMLCANSVHIFPLLAPPMTFIAPFMLFSKPPSEIFDLIFVHIHSKALLIYAGLFLIISITHLFINWLGEEHKDKTEDKSWIYILLSKLVKRRKVNIFFVTLFLQPLIVIAAGFCSWKLGGDIYLAVYLWVSAANLLRDELIQYSKYLHNKSIMDI